MYANSTADFLVSLDCPPRPDDTRSTRALLRRRTLSHLKRLAEFVPAQQLLPVVHGHSVREILEYCECVERICGNVPQIAIGGLVPLMCSGSAFAAFSYIRTDGARGDRSHWVGDSISLVRGCFPDSLIHVFGVGSATTAIAVLALGANSVDSMSWRRAANYGAILLPGRSERFPTARADRKPSRPVVSPTDVSLIAACLCPVCKSAAKAEKRLRLLAECYTNRAIHNAWTVLSEVAKLRAALSAGEAETFVQSRLLKTHRLYKPVMERLRLAAT
ncbi:MAG: hypothetical protein IH602_05670 [Bryobacteraceae bacterium]|nr:hypothetical protein [Bryobacteraceae bacterium]